VRVTGTTSQPAPASHRSRSRSRWN
jgi:hypothetical protein